MKKMNITWIKNNFATNDFKRMLVTALLFICSSFCYGDTLTIDKIAASVLVGEAYPSGNLYLKRFFFVDVPAELSGVGDEPIPTSAAPTLVKAYCMTLQACSNPAVNKIARDFVLFKSNTLNEDTYLPSKEGMVGAEDTECGKSFKHTPSFHYADNDFFETVLDYCDFSDYDTVISYRAVSPSVKNLAYSVFAVADDMNLNDIVYFPKGIKRPLTSAERTRVNEEKTRYAKVDQKDCATNPTFLDEAEKILEANVTRTPYKLRLSSYSNAGCSGHLAFYYILDILDKDKPKKTYFVMHYYGPV